MTGQEMSEYVAAWLTKLNGSPVTWEEVWNASPTGKLSHVFGLYAEARAANGDPLPGTFNIEG